jgi:hypothetical protein
LFEYVVDRYDRLMSIVLHNIKNQSDAQLSILTSLLV